MLLSVNSSSHTHIHMYICIFTVRQWICLPLVHLTVFSQLYSCQICFVYFFAAFLLCLLYTLFSGSPVSRANNLCLLNLPVLVCGCSTLKGSFKLCAITAAESSLLLSIRSFLWLHCIWRVCLCVCVYLFVLFGPLLAHFVVAVHFWAVSVDLVDVLLFGGYFDWAAAMSGDACDVKRFLFCYFAPPFPALRYCIYSYIP